MDDDSELHFDDVHYDPAERDHPSPAGSSYSDSDVEEGTSMAEHVQQQQRTPRSRSPDSQFVPGWSLTAPTPPAPQASSSSSTDAAAEGQTETSPLGASTSRHRPTLSVPDASSAPSRQGRRHHRRTQSVSPPEGVSFLEHVSSQQDREARQRGRATPDEDEDERGPRSARRSATPKSREGSPALGEVARTQYHPLIQPHHHRHGTSSSRHHRAPSGGSSASSSPIAIGGVRRRTSPSPSRTSPSTATWHRRGSSSSGSGGSPVLTSISGTTPPSHHHAAASSHAALLSGIRSHAHPPSPLMHALQHQHHYHVPHHLSPSTSPSTSPSQGSFASMSPPGRQSSSFMAPMLPTVTSVPTPASLASSQSPPFGPVTPAAAPTPSTRERRSSATGECADDDASIVRTPFSFVPNTSPPSSTPAIVTSADSVASGSSSARPVSPPLYPLRLPSPPPLPLPASLSPGTQSRPFQLSPQPAEVDVTTSPTASAALFASSSPGRPSGLRSPLDDAVVASSAPLAASAAMFAPPPSPHRGPIALPGSSVQPTSPQTATTALPALPAVPQQDRRRSLGQLDRPELSVAPVDSHQSSGDLSEQSSVSAGAGSLARSPRKRERSPETGLRSPPAVRPVSPRASRSHRRAPSPEAPPLSSTSAAAPSASAALSAMTQQAQAPTSPDTALSIPLASTSLTMRDFEKEPHPVALGIEQQHHPLERVPSAADAQTRRHRDEQQSALGLVPAPARDGNDMGSEHEAIELDAVGPTARPGFDLADREMAISGLSSDEDGIDENGMIAEHQLSALERIFMCANSDEPGDRARVAWNLSTWLEAVDVCEAVEYVLPLLNVLATDGDTIVKECFAPHLDEVMWYFYSQCPLDGQDDATLPMGHANATPKASARGARRTRSSSDMGESPTTGSERHSPPSPYRFSNESTPPTTSKTSPADADLGTSLSPPRIPSTAFTSLLGALLTDQSAFVADCAQAAFVRFLCRLKDRACPSHEHSEALAQLQLEHGDTDTDTMPAYHVDDAHAVVHRYRITQRAREALEEECVHGIVLGLARLDEDERPRAMSAIDSTSQTSSPAGTPRIGGDQPPRGVRAHRGLSTASSDDMAHLEHSPAISPRDPGRTPPTLTTTEPLSEGIRKPSQQLDDEDDATMDSWLENLTQPRADEDVDMDAPLVENKSGSRNGIRPFSHLEYDDDFGAQSPQISDFDSGDHIYSTFSSPKDGAADDEEASIGKLVSMSLIAAIASARCLDQDVLTNNILPEVARMKRESMLFVRKQAVEALQKLAEVIPAGIVEETIVPLLEAFMSDDAVHVRRTACASLPSVLSRVSAARRCDLVTRHIQSIALDTSADVRSTALEHIGEIIYAFHGDETGVPSVLVDFFLGKPSGERTRSATTAVQDDDDDAFVPMQTALDSPVGSVHETASSWGAPLVPASRSKMDDAERVTMCAFNFPAVALTLGAERWPELAEHYLSLCKDGNERARRSLASSLHHIAEVIGTEQSEHSLLEPFVWWLHDLPSVRNSMLENIGQFLAVLSGGAARPALERLASVWLNLTDWRVRELVMNELGRLPAARICDDVIDDLLSLLARGFKDTVAAVRFASVHLATVMFEATAGTLKPRRQLLAFLNVFAEDGSYRNRTTFLDTVHAIVERELLDVSDFESAFGAVVARLAQDRVINVRICVARIYARACTCARLYAGADERSTINDILLALANSPDADVRAPVMAFAPPLGPSPSQANESHDESMDLCEGNAREGGETAGEDTAMKMDDDMDDAPSTPRQPTSALIATPPGNLASPGDAHNSGGSLGDPPEMTALLDAMASPITDEQGRAFSTPQHLSRHFTGGEGVGELWTTRDLSADDYVEVSRA